MNDPKIIVALDYDNQDAALKLVGQLDPDFCRLKIGKELFTACGPDIVRKVQDLGFSVFLDLKFHDIPVTVAKACRSAANLGVWMLNVHAMGGTDMLNAAREAVNESENTPYLIAVTVLTSFDQQQLMDVGVTRSLNEQVESLALLSQTCGLNGVVCSAKEASMLKEKLGKQFLLVTPGVRPPGSQQDDQKRVMTPSMALRSGSDYLVIGRPITQAKDPMKMLGEIFSQISE